MTKEKILETLKANLQGNLSAFYWKETIYEAMEMYANLRISEQQSKHEQELKKLYEWVLNDKKEPAQTYFSSGIVRNIAREVEFKREQEMKEFAKLAYYQSNADNIINECCGQVDTAEPLIEKAFNEWYNSKDITELLTKFKNR